MKISLAATGAAMLTLALLAGTAHARMDAGRGMSASAPRISSGGMRTGSASFGSPRTFSPDGFGNSLTTEKQRTRAGNRRRPHDQDPPDDPPEKGTDKDGGTGTTKTGSNDNPGYPKPHYGGGYHGPHGGGYYGPYGHHPYGGYCYNHPC